MGSSRARITKASLDRAREVLITKAISDDEGYVEDPFRKLVLARELSLESFERWLKGREGKSAGMKVAFDHGNIIAEELVSAPHGDTVGDLIGDFRLQDLNKTLVFSAEHSCYNAQNTACVEADILIKALGQYGGNFDMSKYGRGFPVAVVEVGVAQSGPDLHRKLSVYRTIPSIQYYWAIKRYPSGGMVSMLFTRANNFNPPSIVSFGTQPLHSSVIDYFTQQGWLAQCTGVGFPGGVACNAPFIPMYMVGFNAQILFINCVGGVPIGAPGQLVIDLFSIQGGLEQQP